MTELLHRKYVKSYLDKEKLQKLTKITKIHKPVLPISSKGIIALGKTMKARPSNSNNKKFTHCKLLHRFCFVFTSPTILMVPDEDPVDSLHTIEGSGGADGTSKLPKMNLFKP